MQDGSMFARGTGGSFRDFLRLWQTAQLHNIAGKAKEIAGNTAAIKNGLDRAIGGLESLGAAVSHGMMAQLGQMEAQNKTLSSQLQQLESIDEALRNPDAIRAREWFVRGEDLLAKGLYDLALDAFSKSADIYEANHLVQLNIGRLYLFGVDEDCDVTDTGKAVERLALATRISKAEARLDESAKGSCAECHFYLSLAQYILGNERYAAGDGTGATDLYRAAAKSATAALELAPRFSEARHQLCKCLALLGERAEALKQARMLVAAKPEYAAKLKSDGDTAPLADELKASPDRDALLAACDVSFQWASEAMVARHLTIDTEKGPDDALMKKLGILEEKEAKDKLSARERSDLVDTAYEFRCRYAGFIENVTGIDDNDERFMSRYGNLYTDFDKPFFQLLYDREICYVEAVMKNRRTYRIHPDKAYDYVGYADDDENDDDGEMSGSGVNRGSYTGTALFGKELDTGKKVGLPLGDMNEMRLKWNPWALQKRSSGKELRKQCEKLSETVALGLAPVTLSYINLDDPEGQPAKREKASGLSISTAESEGVIIEYAVEGGSNRRRLNLGLVTALEGK